MKKIWTSLAALTLAAILAVPALADTVNARLKSVDTTANTITVTEARKDRTIVVNEATKYLNAKGEELADGIKSADLKAGARLAITYTTQDDKSIASEIKLRGPRGPRQGNGAPGGTAPGNGTPGDGTPGTTPGTATPGTGTTGGDTAGDKK